MKLKKTRLAKAIALTVAGGALSFGVAGTASAHTMYNTFVGADASATDGWNYGGVGNPTWTNVSPGWVGTASATTLPFGYSGGGWLNWAAEVHHAGDSLTISHVDSLSRYGIAADIDTNKGSWNDDGGTGFGRPQGWAHNTDIGLIKTEEDAYVTLNLTNMEGTWTNFGITVFEGMDTSGQFVNHHAAWNCPTCTPTALPYTASNPFGLSSLAYLAHDDTVDTTNGLTFLAQAGQVYSVFLGGKEFGSVFSPTALYQLNITTAPVPVPAAIWLFGSALAGMGVFGRRKAQVA